GDQINTASWDWYSTLRVRAGLAAGNALGYVTGGVVIASPDYSFGEPGVNLVTSSPTQVGLAIGAGAEYALGGNWTARLEYLYLGLPEDLIAETWGLNVAPFGGDTGSFVSSAHMARLGVNYMFGGDYSAGSGTVLPDAIDWNGWHAGVVGSAMMVSSTSTEYAFPWDYGEYSITDWAGAGGVVAGFNMQTGNFVYGAEADWSWTSWDERHNFATDGSNEAQMSWLATARGRAGIAAGSSLLYVTGGAAFAN
ncbi:MAG: outer membrane beta-barrel protein, partial [Alphaproteobacteria bacterium]|nr:outer membrane beta-barrel protein [Alphaproteobacteria bacterium]